MKKLVLFLFIAQASTLTAFSQYWQQQVNYTIDVSLNDKDHSLDGYERIEYINNSPDTIRFIWFHLWPNAYKNDKTAYSDQQLENGNTKFYFSDRDDRGYINRLDFKVNNVTATMEDHPQHIDIVKLILPEPILPGQKTSITTPFHVKLPFNFSRIGHDGESYQLTQWYPKPAVYDSKGWHPMPYLDQGEFYSEFGNFEVSITVPRNYVVAATGELQETSELEWMKSRSSFNWTPIKTKEKVKGGIIKTTTQLFPASDNGTKTLVYKMSKVHDFAWFADKRFIVNHDTCKLASGKVVDVFTYYTPAHKKTWQRSVQFCKDALRFYSALVGEYPFSVVSAVQGPESFGGGMEYPTITVISPTNSEKELDLTIAHELGHNWFYGILASNERDHPWMDEGLNTYYDHKYMNAKYGPQPQYERLYFESKARDHTDQPIDLPAEKFSAVNYELAVYYKTGEWMNWLETDLGTDAFNRAMQEYYHRWQFRHPQPGDFRSTIEESSGKKIDTIFSYLGRTGKLPNRQTGGLLFGYNIKNVQSYLKDPMGHLILIAPAIGFNSYDKFMLGAFVTNYTLPLTRLKFFLAPMYGFGSKRLSGLGTLKYSSQVNIGWIRKVDIFLNGSSFSYDEFKKLDNEMIRFAFKKACLGARFTAKEKNPRSNSSKYLQWKSFFISEESFGKITYDTVGSVITQHVPTKSDERWLHQLKFVIENHRALYPFSMEWKIDNGDHFIRADFTWKYFFNYPKQGGLNLRLFAGKFFYTGSKTSSQEFSTSRYHINMTGANGYEDYTYHDYFIGRNKFEGLASQQIMENDGGFKVRTDLYANKIGKTDDWLIALNLNTTIPPGINPLNLLPLKIPLRVFVDIGTNAEAWKKNAETNRFIFDAGLHIPLLKETVNIYFPLIYSDVFKEYIQSTLPKNNRFAKKISFSIDLSSLTFRKINRNLEF